LFQVGDVGATNATLTITQNASHLERYLKSYGNVSMAALLSSDVQDSGGIDNYGTFDIGVDKGILNNSGGTLSLKNYNIFRKSAGTQTSNIGLNFENDMSDAGAELLVQSGTLKFLTPWVQNAGLTQVSSGATLAFNSTAVQNAGNTVLLNSATLAITGEYKIEGGSLSNTGTSTVQGNLRLDAGDIYPGNDGSVGTLKVTGNYTQPGGTLHIDNIIGTGNDVLDVSNGNVNLITLVAGAPTLTVNTVGMPTAGNSYTIILYVQLQGMDFGTRNFTYTGGYYTDTTNGGRYTITAHSSSAPGQNGPAPLAVAGADNLLLRRPAAAVLPFDPMAPKMDLRNNFGPIFATRTSPSESRPWVHVPAEVSLLDADLVDVLATAGLLMNNPLAPWAIPVQR
jgi:hypothetical protein